MPRPGGAATTDAVGGGGTESDVISAIVLPPLPSLPASARPTDVAAVRAAVAKVLVYPPSARRLRLEGRVVLLFTLHVDGSVGDLRIEQSSGFSMLDAAAIDGVRRAAPFPRPDGERQLTLPVTFRLET